MKRVRVERAIDADPDTLRAAIADVGPFMRAAGFDEVTVDGDRIEIANHVGLLTIELDLRQVEREDAVLAYEQVEGIFEDMETRYFLEPGADGTTVAAETTFALDAAFVGPVLDATIINRQRKRELTAQFDYLESLGSD
jgi:hypothetical protein